MGPAANDHARPPDVAIVIPTHDESPPLEQLLPTVRRTLDDLGLQGEIAIVDGRGGRTVASLAARHGSQLVRAHATGYGPALQAGFAATSASCVITLEGDCAAPELLIQDLWTQRDTADVLVASTALGAASSGTPILRRALNRFYARLVALPVRDLASGYRLYHRRVLDGLTLQTRDFSALAESLIRIHGEGWHIREIPLRVPPATARARDAHVWGIGQSFVRSTLRLWRLRNSVVSADYDFRAFDSVLWFQRYWQRTRYRIVMDLLEDHTNVLDVGCGSGRIIVDLPDAVGLDILHRKLRWLRPHHRLLVRGSADGLPFHDASFATIVCSEVIEHIPDVPEVIGEMTRVLRPGGLLIIGTPDYSRRLWCTLEWIYGKVLPDAYADEHITHFTHDSLAARLRSAGYEILDCRYLVGSVVIFKARKPAPVRAAVNGTVKHPTPVAALATTGVAPAD